MLAIISAYFQLASGILFAIPTAKLIYYYYRWGRPIQNVRALSLQGIRASLEEIYQKRRDAILAVDVVCFVLAFILMLTSSTINLLVLLPPSSVS